MKLIKILLIDDEKDYCLLMKNFFLRNECEVQMAYSINEGLQMIEKFLPHILFLDNNLPDGKGWNYVDEIVEKRPEIQIHLVSAYRPAIEHIVAKDKIKVWEKPISLKDLSEILVEFKSNSCYN